jgi:hypothetical protein
MFNPNKGCIYAVGTGTYVGEMFVFIENKQDDYCFISIPKNVNREVPKDKFVLGLNSQIIDYVGQIDSDVLDLLEKQFVFNKQMNK